MRHDLVKMKENAVRLNVLVGKDILELLSSSMYVNPLTIYREYVQNAADSIDEAVEAGELGDRSEGRVEIKIDHIGRRAVIRDNGAGVSPKKFLPVLTAFGASQKRGTSARGFRGVGRLAGLGYCQMLIFRSRQTADEAVNELSWDCRRLKELLADPMFRGGLDDLVNQVATHQKIKSNDFPARFFEVEMIQPRRIGADVLVNEEKIEAFLSQVGPVPFSPEFSRGVELCNLLSEKGVKLAEFDIRLNDREAPIYRPHRDIINHSNKKSIKFNEIEVTELFANDGEPAGVAWLMHHDYQGAIPQTLGVSGFRARSGNIQVGDERIFSDIFPEERFNSWAVAELHVIDNRITPNGRRDDFEQNRHFADLVNHLTPLAGKVAHQCRSSSQIRNRIRAFHVSEERVKDSVSVVKQGVVSKSHKNFLLKEANATLQKMEKIADSHKLDVPAKKDMKAKLNKLRKDVDKAGKPGRTKDPVAKIEPLAKQRGFRHALDLMYQCSKNTASTKAHIERMLEKL